MGPRRKLLYKSGKLTDIRTGEVVREWDARSELIEPSEYRVFFQTTSGRTIRIHEDEQGIWLDENGLKSSLSLGRVKLPRFEGHPHAKFLRTLHQEILFNILDGKPLPNLLVYSKPWYRDSAMVMMVLEKTGNLGLVKDWVLGLREPFDKNNAGEREPDNLGQALYMISLVSNARHPLVRTVLDTITEFRRSHYITGRSDFAEHPVYQTKWLKYGLRKLKLKDDLEIPSVSDSYSSLFWMDFPGRHVAHDRFGKESIENYPYLGWAEAHFYADKPPMPVDLDPYPLTWESHASQAEYKKMALISEEHVKQKVCTPHSWHAAEMFLYYWEQLS
jgi:hypothetical protein